MLLELSEILACPVCGPPQVMVAVVHESVGRRVVRGFLGCPTCDSRFPIEDGALYLDRPESGVEPEATGAPEAAFTQDLAMLVGAVLDVAGGSGHLLLAPELGAIADAVAGVAESWEVVSLAAVEADRPTRAPNLSRIVVSGDRSPPVLAGRCGAAALAGDPRPDRIREFAAALGSMGRLAVVTPAPGVTAAMREAGLEVLASDDRVAVGSRQC